MANWKKILIGEWNWKRPFKSLAFIYGSLLIVAVTFSNKLIYQPPTPGYHESDANIHIAPQANGHNIALFHLPPAADMPTLFWSHGNAEDIGHLRSRFESFRARGYGILAYDYPGYGLSDGKPTEQGCYDACSTAWDYLTKQLKIKPENIIIYGQSVGSGPACWIATQAPSSKLVLVAPITSAFRTVTHIPLFPGDQYPNIKRISSIHTPLLIIHGDNDNVVGQWNGRKLYSSHPGPKHFVSIEGAGHNDLFYLATEQILGELDEFRKREQIHKTTP